MFEVVCVTVLKIANCRGKCSISLLFIGDRVLMEMPSDCYEWRGSSGVFLRNEIGIH